MQSTNTLGLLSRDTPMPQGSATSRATALKSERDERDAGPWLALIALISLALTVLVVSYMSRLSF